VTELATEAAASSSGPAPVLSRREREEIEKERARANYQRLHAQGKTDEARADLARLAIIRYDFLIWRVPLKFYWSIPME
jgi:Casein kinase substrate phosphoprotein PP28